MKFILFFSLVLNIASAQADLALYTDRPTARMQVVADEFLKATGTNVLILELPWKDLKAKLAAEGANSPADVIFVKDALYLNELQKNGQFAKLNSSVVTNNVHTSMFTDYYTAVTFRARTLIYESSLDVSGINTYADLAKPDYQGALCLRTSNSGYNEALVADFIVRYGYEGTKNMLAGWINNRVDTNFVYPNDNAIIGDVASGKCALGITNSYYLGLQLLQNPAMPVSIKFLEQGTGGVHTNGSGAGISASSKQQDLAKAFVEFLLREDIQAYLSESHQDYPANVNVALPTATKSWGKFDMNFSNWSNITDTAEQARKLVNEVGYL